MYYQSADIILFPQASISCQEAMGTGAHIYTIADPALNHLQQLYDRLWMVDVEQWPHSLFQMIHHKYVLDDVIRHQSATQVRTHLAYPNLVKEAFRQLAYNLSETGEKISY